MVGGSSYRRGRTLLLTLVAYTTSISAMPPETCAATALHISSTIAGTKLPVLGLGTWRSDKGKVKAAVTEAIRLGYRHIDAAQVYQNQDEVGEGIQDAIDQGYCKLEDLWVTSKIWNYDHRPEHVRPACEKILRELRLPKISHLIIHWPTAFQRVEGEEGQLQLFPKDGDGSVQTDTEQSITDMWREMEKLVDDGLAESIGVSNFNDDEIKEILEVARHKPLSNQVECHPMLNQNQLRAFLNSHRIALVAYSPLGNLNPSDESAPSPLKDDTILELAKKYNKSPAQICIRWGLQKGNSVIPKTVTLSRLTENMDVFDFSISDEDMDAIDKMKQQRLVNPNFRAGNQPVFSDSMPSVIRTTQNERK